MTNAPSMACVLMLAQASSIGVKEVPTVVANPWVIFAAPIAWAGIWIQVAIRFYGEAEKLHKDYHTSGVLNSARSAIESDSLIPALSKMFDRAMESRDDLRRKVVMSQLLQAVEFLPDFEAAQKAMASIEELDQKYRELKLKSSRIWKWAASHAMLTPLPVAVYGFTNLSNTWAAWCLSVAGVTWFVSLVAASHGCIRFHRLMSSFNDAIESHGGVAT